MADEFNSNNTDDAATSGWQGAQNSPHGALHTSDGVRRDGIESRAHQLQHAASESGRDLLDQAVVKKDELKARASTALDDGRHQISDRVGSIARALHNTAENLEQDGERQMSLWVHQAADQVDRVVGYLNGRDAGSLMHDMEDLARRNPALFLGGTYAAGLALGRFLRASSPERRTTADDAHVPEPELGYEGASPSTGNPWTGVGVSHDHFGAGEASGSGSGSADAGREGFGASPSDARGSFGGSGRAGDTPRTDDLASERYGAEVPRGSVPLASSADDAGLTDEDLRAAWHERDAREQERMRSASRSERADDLDTGELTRYTNGDTDRSREV